jgi:fibronectin-binding autotransporter adhesin
MLKPSRKSSHFLRASLLACLASTTIGQLHATEIVKANNTNTLNLTTSWVGGSAPGSSDIAVFNSTLTVSRTFNIGVNQNWAGIKMTDAAAGTTQTVGATTGYTLTLGSSGIDMSAATADLAITAVMDLSASQTWTVAAGRTLTVSGTNTGTGTISLSGAGTFALGGNTSTTAFGTGTLNLGDGITLTSSSTSSRAIANSVNITGNIGVSMTGASSSVMTFNGNIDIGSGTRVISVSNANGSATNNTVTFAGGGLAGTNQITGSGVLDLENGNGSASPVVSVKFGTSNTDYSVVQTDVTVGNGVSIFFGAANVFGAESDLTVKTGGVVNLSNNSGSSYAETFKSISGEGMITNNTTSAGGVATITIDGGSSTATTTFTGVIQNGAKGLVSVVKSGSSTQVLSGANNYTGATTINGGTLLVNGTHIQTASGSGYTVSSGGTLGGTGRISRYTPSSASTDAISVASGGFVAPGDSNSIGTLTLDGVNFGSTNKYVLRMQSGAQFNFDLAGNGTPGDQIAFWNYVSTGPGDLSLSSNAINLSLVGTQTAGTYTVSIFTFYSDSGTSVVSSGISTGLTLGTLGAGISNASITYNTNSIDVTYTVSAIPEPASWAAILGAVALAGTIITRRRKQS